MVLWMAVRIHYRPGLLHSSKKDRQKKKQQLGLAFKIIVNNGTKTFKKKSFRTPHEFLICMFFLLTHLTVQQECRPSYSTSDIFKDVKVLLVPKNVYQLMPTLTMNKKKLTCNSTHAKSY